MAFGLVGERAPVQQMPIRNCTLWRIYSFIFYAWAFHTHTHRHIYIWDPKYMTLRLFLPLRLSTGELPIIIIDEANDALTRRHYAHEKFTLPLLATNKYCVFVQLEWPYGRMLRKGDHLRHCERVMNSQFICTSIAPMYSPLSAAAAAAIVVAVAHTKQISLLKHISISGRDYLRGCWYL